MDHFSVVSNGRKNHSPGCPEFNSGFMVFRPSETLYREIMECIRANPDREFSHGDQGVLNHFFYEKHPDKISLVDKNWNRSIKNEAASSFCIDQVILVHFLGKKPWTKRLLSVIGFRPSGSRIHYHRLWWDYYLRSLVTVYTGFVPTRSPEARTRYLMNLVKNKLSYRGRLKHPQLFE